MNLLNIESPAHGADEASSILIQSGDIRIERIVSHSSRSPEGFWYDQPDDEWVAVLRGFGTVVFEDGHSVRLGPGDWLYLPAHQKHRVLETDPSGPTIWLAVFFPPQP